MFICKKGGNFNGKCHCLVYFHNYACIVTQCCWTLCDPRDWKVSQKEYWSRLACPHPGDFPNSDQTCISCITGELFTTEPFSSVAQSCLTLCNPMNHCTPGLPVHHQLPEFTQTHVHWVSGAIQPSHPLSSPSLPALNLSQHQGLFKWVSSSHQVAKVLEFQLQHQSFQWSTRTDLL